MKIGNKIQNLRKKNSMSQENLADIVGVTRQTISKWELNETSPDISEAKKLSNIFKVSLDELVDNDIKNIIEEKVSNTERLAGITIKLIKTFGILFGILSLLIILFVALTIIFKKQPETSNEKETTLNCEINTKEYTITIGSNNYFDCPKCDTKMQIFLKDITDWSNLDQSKKNINKYFNENGGSCKEIKD